MSDYSMTEKRSALAAFVRPVLQAIDERYQVDERLRMQSVQGRSRRDRVQIMGDPVRYCLLMPVAFDFTTDPGATSQRRGPLERSDRFAAQLWHEYEDASAFEDSSQATFEEVVDGPEGLIRQLAGAPWLEGAGALGAPSGGQLDVVAMDSRGQELAHFLSFTITVT